MRCFLLSAADCHSHTVGPPLQQWRRWHPSVGNPILVSSATYWMEQTLGSLCKSPLSGCQYHGWWSLESRYHIRVRDSQSWTCQDANLELDRQSSLANAPMRSENLLCWSSTLYRAHKSDLESVCSISVPWGLEPYKPLLQPALSRLHNSQFMYFRCTWAWLSKIDHYPRFVGNREISTSLTLSSIWRFASNCCTEEQTSHNFTSLPWRYYTTLISVQPKLDRSTKGVSDFRGLVRLASDSWSKRKARDEYIASGTPFHAS